jgi:hypothetical protein
MGDRCAVERRLGAGRVHYLAVAGGEVVARSPGFDPQDAQADAAALGQLGRVLGTLGWRPVGSGGLLYERG